MDINEIKKVFKNNKDRICQMSRVEKYIKRNNYLEAYMKYLENIANPLVKIVRLLYTPRHYDYLLCHISNHLPSSILREIESLYKVSSLEDIAQKLKEALKLLKKYEKNLKRKYNI